MREYIEEYRGFTIRRTGKNILDIYDKYGHCVDRVESLIASIARDRIDEIIDRNR